MKNGKEEQDNRGEFGSHDESREADYRAGSEGKRPVGKSLVRDGGDDIPRSESMRCPICEEEHELIYCIPLGIECCELCAEEYRREEGFSNVNEDR